MKKRVVLFNGPPNSGKDFSADICRELLGFGERRGFKTKLYEITARHFGLEYFQFVRDASGRNTKEKKMRHIRKPTKGFLATAIAFLIGLFSDRDWLSPREALIHVSENIIKPVYGKDFFGKALAEHIGESDQELFLVSDSGFIEELDALVEAGFDVKVIRMYREGADYGNDSRRYLTDEELHERGVPVRDIHNNGTVDELHEELMRYLTTDLWESPKHG